MPKSTFNTPGATVPSSSEYYSLNPTGTNNAVAKAEANVYHRPATTSIGSNSEYTSFESLEKNQAVRVLFAMDDYYCIQTDKSTGFVEKSAIKLNPVLTGITAAATKTTFAFGETIDESVISVFAKYSDGSQAALNLQDVTVNKPSTETSGEKVIVVSYGDYQTAIPVLVKSPEKVGIEVMTMPSKTLYATGTDFDSAGMQVVLNYDNGTHIDITEECTFSYDFSAPGDQQVTVRYEDFSSVIPVVVYTAPTVLINSMVGYKGETVSVVVSYSGENVNAYSLQAALSYDSTNLLYKGFVVGEGLDATRFYINAGENDLLMISAAKDEPITSDCVLFELKFTVKNDKSDSELENEYPICFSEFELFGTQDAEYEVIRIPGRVENLGDVEINYDPNGGENAPEPQSVPYGTRVNVPSTIPTKSGNIFLGWARESDATTPEYIQGDGLDCIRSMTLYAVWEAHTHAYDNACDKSCNVCGATRTVPAHKYDNTCDTTCNECGAERTITHTYDNACDAECNVCKATRQVPDHVYESDYDTTCNVCGAVRVVCGDFDGKDGVDMDDVIYILFHVNFPETYPVNQSADFDGNGKEDMDDAIYLLFHVYFPEDYPLH
ncbi:MAG: bacterial Ig-like domain-containing protein [Clostridia bacterium]|nr:bacterial Ig-like domain-containing protein [Clostridia bacterium]